MDVKQAKLNIIERFYGIESFVDLEKNVPESVQHIVANVSEFETIMQLIDLDVWYISVVHRDTGARWNPFKESLKSFAGGTDNILLSEILLCSFYPTLQYEKSDIVKFLKK